MHERTHRRSAPPIWGLRLAPTEQVRARVVEFRWRWPVLAALVVTVPAFYLELLDPSLAWLAALCYLTGATVLAVALMHTARATGHVAEHLRANPLDLALVAGLVLAALLPPSKGMTAVLVMRLAVAFITLLRMVWGLQHVITRGGLGSMMVSAFVVLLSCGVGYWWLEPTTPTLGEGLWLAFVTAATVGYGDVVPTTTASKIFSVFVVLLGFGVLMVVTAAIATRWVEAEERIIEREILRDVHRQIDALRADIAGLREQLDRALRDRR